MTRSRASAKRAGARFERLIADHLAAHVDPRIDRLVRRGSRDRGDIGGLRSAHELPVVVECKDEARLQLAAWWGEAVVERGNADAAAAVVAHKRRGHASAGGQWVTLTVDDLIVLVTGVRPGEGES